MRSVNAFLASLVLASSAHAAAQQITPPTIRGPLSTQLPPGAVKLPVESGKPFTPPAKIEFLWPPTFYQDQTDTEAHVEFCVTDAAGAPAPVASAKARATIFGKDWSDAKPLFEPANKSKPGSIAKLIPGCFVHRYEIVGACPAPGMHTMEISVLLDPSVIRAQSGGRQAPITASRPLHVPPYKATIADIAVAPAKPTYRIGDIISISGTTKSACPKLTAGAAPLLYSDDLSALPTAVATVSGWKAGPIVLGNPDAPGAKLVDIDITIPATETSSAAKRTISLPIAPLDAYFDFALNAPNLTAGVPTSLAGTLRWPDGAQVPRAGIKVRLAITQGAQELNYCIGTTNAVGEVGGCVLGFPMPQPSMLADPSVRLQASLVANGQKIPVRINGKESSLIRVLTKDGLTTRLIPAQLLADLLDETAPGGVLLNNFDGGRSPPHFPNASWLYLDRDLSKAKNFDLPVPTISIAVSAWPDVTVQGYMDRIFVRLGKPEILRPDRLRIPLTVEGFQGQGPRIVGWCVEWWCPSGLVPDFNNVWLKESFVEGRIGVEDGAIAVLGGSAKVTLGFTCSGVFDAFCGDIRNAANNAIAANLDTAINSPALRKQINDNLKTSMGTIAGIATLTRIEVQDNGDIHVYGTPAK